METGVINNSSNISHQHLLQGVIIITPSLVMLYQVMLQEEKPPLMLCYF